MSFSRKIASYFARPRARASILLFDCSTNMWTSIRKDVRGDPRRGPAHRCQHRQAAGATRRSPFMERIHRLISSQL